MSKQYEIEGATLEVDGRVYFIPARELDAYRVPDDLGRELRPALEADVAGFSIGAGRPVAPIGAVFGWVPIDRSTHPAGYTSEDFITVSRVH